MKTKILLTTILMVVAWLLSGANVLYAQSCGCTYTVTASGTYDNDVLQLAAGSTICPSAADPVS